LSPGLVISDRELRLADDAATVVFRPPTLVAGIGCCRGVPCEEIEELFQLVFREHGLAPVCLGVVATASLKASEPGLHRFAACHKVPLRSYAADKITRLGPLPTPSPVVQAKVGLPGVAEPAAMLAAKVDRLVVNKVRGRRVTLAVARREA
jgi:cobalamin biosynthesis protein CbiG